MSGTTNGSIPEDQLPKSPVRLCIIYEEESHRGLTHPFFVLILDAFKREAEALGCELTFINSAVADKSTGYAEYCRAGHLDGVCVICADFAAPRLQDLVAAGFPCLTVDHIFKHVPAVLSDNETGMRKLIEYAIKKGHKRIAYVHGHNNSLVTRTRIKQFQNTMGYQGLPIPSEYLRESEYNNIPMTRKIVRQLLELPERPTCILLSDDMTYLGAQDAARECALRIPEDISFAGYDGIPITQALKPSLTTVRQDTEEMGRLAARHLVRLVREPSKASRLPAILPVELIEGGTIADI